MYLVDEPITNFDDDKLNRNPFVTRLAQTIENWVSRDSLALGVYGPWGSGKSSVLKLLESEIRKTQISRKKTNNNIAVVNFDPWFFNSEEQLLTTFYSAIENAITEIAPQKASSIKKFFRNYSNKLSFALSPEISIGPIKISLPLNKDQTDETPNQIKEKLVSELKEIEGRVIVLIDNIDRLDPSELMLIFKLVRLCSDFPNFIYVLAFDQYQVRNILEKQLEIDADFLEKIIQIDINLPKIDQTQVDSFVNDGINEIAELHQIHFEENIGERFGGIYQKYIKSHIADLRTAKRYLNAASFSMPLVKGEVNYADFLALEFIRVFSPTAFNEIPKYEKELTSFDVMYIGRGDNFHRRERFEIFQKFREWLRNNNDDEDLYRACEEIIGFLFPIFGAYIRNPSNPQYVTHDLRPAYERSQHIASPTHFKRYFRLQIDSGDIPTTIISSFVQTLNSSTIETPVNYFVDFMKAFKEKKQLPQLLEKLIVYTPNISGQGRLSLSKAITNISDELDTSDGNNWSSEITKGERLILKCIPSQDIIDFETHISDIVQTSPSLVFATLIVSRVLSPKHTEDIPENLNQEIIKEAFRDRLHLDIIENNINIFTEYPNYFGRILSLWKSELVLNETDLANNYVYEKLKQNSHTIAQVLSGFAWKDTSNGEFSGLEFPRLEEVYDVDVLNSILSKQPDDINWDKFEKAAIEEFIKLYQERQQRTEDS